MTITDNTSMDWEGHELSGYYSDLITCGSLFPLVHEAIIIWCICQLKLIRLYRVYYYDQGL